jgi:hypothetical protein
MFRRCLIPAVITVVVCTVANAGTEAGERSEREPGPDSVVRTQEHGDADGRGEHAGGVDLPRNAIGVVAGATFEREEEETYFTLGVEYGRELSHRWGATLVAEHLSDIDAWVFVAPFTFRPGSKHFHPKSHLLLAFGPGFEHKSRRVRAIETGEHAGELEVERAEDLFLFRAGIRYPIHVGDRYIIVPAIDVDFVREHGEWVEAVVVDVSFGFTF